MHVLPVPRWLQYDPEKPVEFSILLNVVFAFASTTIVFNLYYCQPLLIQLAASFGVNDTRVANIPTLTQAGYACGLLLLSPLGDLVPCRSLILVCVVCSTCFALGLALAPNLEVFNVVTFLVGVSNITPQVLLPLTADLSPPERRGQAMSIVLSGSLLGTSPRRHYRAIQRSAASGRPPPPKVIFKGAAVQLKPIEQYGRCETWFEVLDGPIARTGHGL